MTKKLYVGNLPYTMTDNDLSQLFGQVGAVTSARVVMDRPTGRSKGFGFVEMADAAAAEEAIQKLNNTQVGDRTIRVDFASEQSRPGGGGGGGGRPHFGGGGGRPPRR